MLCRLSTPRVNTCIVFAVMFLCIVARLVSVNCLIVCLLNHLSRPLTGRMFGPGWIECSGSFQMIVQLSPVLSRDHATSLIVESILTSL